MGGFLRFFLTLITTAKKDAFLSAGGDHAVSPSGIVIDRVPGVQDFDVILHGHLEVSGNNIVELLADVGGQMDGASCSSSK